MNKVFKILGITLCLVLLVLSLKSANTPNTLKKVNIVETKGTNNKIKFIKTEDIELATDKWKSSPAVCVDAQSGDSSIFGLSLAVNDYYLAVGDPMANRVVIYSKSENGNWIREQEILPPKNSIPDKVGFGFGRGLALDKDVLIIFTRISKLNSEVVHQEYFQEKSSIYSTFRAVYKTTLNKEAKVERIDSKIKNAIPGNLTAAGDGKIAFTTYKRKENGSRNITTHVIVNNKVYHFPKKEHLKKINEFSPNGIFIKNNLLILKDTNSEDYELVYNLNQPNEEPYRLITPDIFSKFKYRTISDEFIVGTNGSEHYQFQKASPLKTVIKSIKNGSTTMIDDYGTLLLWKNILLRNRSARDGIEEPNTLEIFFLDQEAIPYLIDKRIIDGNYAYHASFKNGLLATSIRGKKVCVESFY